MGTRTFLKRPMSTFTSFIHQVNILKHIPVFAKLNWFELQRIARKSYCVHYKKGAIIYETGEAPEFFYCLVSGRIQNYTRNAQHKKQNVDFIHRGTPFGIVAILTGTTQTMTSEALNDSVVLKIPKADFEATLKAVPQLGVELSQTLSHQIQRHTNGEGPLSTSKIISVYSPNKGSGSSAYATNLALSLEKETQKKVLFVNIQSAQQKPNNKPFKNEATPRWKTPALSLEALMNNPSNITKAINKDSLTIDLLNVVFDPKDMTHEHHIAPFVSTLVGHYHYVVLDLPNNMDDMVLQTLTQSDMVHLITLDIKENLAHIPPIIDKLEKSLNVNFNPERIRVIIRTIRDHVYLSFEEIDKMIDFSVYTMIPFVKHHELTNIIDTPHLTFCAPLDQSEFAKKVTHIAREIGDVLIGLVLGGGAALGLAHIGVLRVLEEENIPIDMVVGSSMGALIGSLWTTGQNSDSLEEIAKEFEKKRNLLKLFDPVIPISGLIGGHGITKWLKKHLGSKTFYSTSIPLKIVAYDLKRREELVINSGSLVTAVRQSISIPGVMDPIKKDDKTIIDGGVLNPLPTNVLAAHGIKKIIAVNVLQSPDDVVQGLTQQQEMIQKQHTRTFFNSPFKFLGIRWHRLMCHIFVPNISDIIIQTLQATEYVIAQQSSEQADIAIHPDLVGINWFELYKVDQLIKQGEMAARQHLKEIKALVNA